MIIDERKAPAESEPTQQAETNPSESPEPSSFSSEIPLWTPPILLKPDNAPSDRASESLRGPGSNETPSGQAETPLSQYVGEYRMAGSTKRVQSIITLKYIDETCILLQNSILYHDKQLTMTGSEYIEVRVQGMIGHFRSIGLDFGATDFTINFNEDSTFTLHSKADEFTSQFCGLYRPSHIYTKEDEENQLLEDEQLTAKMYTFLTNTEDRIWVNDMYAIVFNKNYTVHYWLEGWDTYRTASFSIDADELTIDGASAIVRLYIDGTDPSKKSIRVDGVVTKDEIEGWFYLVYLFDMPNALRMPANKLMGYEAELPSMETPPQPQTDDFVLPDSSTVSVKP
jgi:hypothetical protein